MSKKHRFFKAGGLYFFGNIFDKAVAFITVPIFTRILSTSDYGYMTTYLSWISILTVFITLSSGNSIRSAVNDFPDEKESYLSSVISLGTFSAIIITAILSTAAFLTGAQSSLPVVLLCCANSYAVSILATIKWRYMMEMKYVRRTLLQCVPNILIVVFAVILMSRMSDSKYFGRLYASTIVSMTIAIAYVVSYLIKGKCVVSMRYWKYAMAFSLPLILHGLSNVVLSQADRSMLTWLKNSSETGLYGLAYQFGMVPLVIITTLENIWIPWFTEKMEEGDKDGINERIKPYIYIVAAICLGVILVAPEILKLMTTDAYYSAVYIIAPVVLGTFFMFLASISIALEYYLRKTKTIALNTIIAASINILLNYIFIPKYGAAAAAYTTVASYFVSFVMHYVFTKRLEGGLFPLSAYIPPILLVSFVTGLSYILMPYAIVRWLIGFTLAAALLLYVKYYLCKL